MWSLIIKGAVWLGGQEWARKKAKQLIEKIIQRASNKVNDLAAAAKVEEPLPVDLGLGNADGKSGMARRDPEF